MKIVLDTNVLTSIAVAPPGSTLSRIYEAWALDIFDVIISDEVIVELERTLKEIPYFSTRLSAKYIGDYIKFVKKYSYTQRIYTSIDREALFKKHDKLPNIEDDSILATAIESNSAFLITADKTIQSLQQIQNTIIVSPSEFLEILYIQSLFPY